jgi:hypothetical protein
LAFTLALKFRAGMVDLASSRSSFFGLQWLQMGCNGLQRLQGLQDLQGLHHLQLNDQDPTISELLGRDRLSATSYQTWQTDMEAPHTPAAASAEDDRAQIIIIQCWCTPYVPSIHAAHAAGITAPPGDHNYGAGFGRWNSLRPSLG